MSPALLTGLGVGGLTGAGVALAEVVLTGAHVNIETAVSVAVFGGSLAWALSRRLQRLEDNQAEIARKYDALAARYEALASLEFRDYKEGQPTIRVPIIHTTKHE